MTFRRVAVAVLAALMVPSLVHAAAEHCTQCADSSSLCGPRALFYVCLLLGVDCTVENLRSTSDYDPGRGTSLLGLQRAAEAHGLQSAVMKIGLDNLCRLGIPGVLLLWDNHFAALAGGDEEVVTLADFPNPPTRVIAADLRRSYSGFALIVAKDPRLLPPAQPEGPDLRLTPRAVDLGVLLEGSSAQCSIQCRNVGSAALAISKVTTDCGSCLVPTVFPSTIPAGAAGDIKVLAVATGGRGSLDARLYVHCNDPITPVVQVNVRSVVRSAQPQWVHTVLDFGERRRGQGASDAIYIPATGPDGVRVGGVNCRCPYLSVKHLDPGDPLSPGHLVRVELQRDAPIGELAATVDVETDHPNHPVVSIPIRADIRGEMLAAPDSFFFGIVKKGDEKKCSVTISTVSKDPLKIEKIESSLACMSVEVVPKTEGKEYTLTATLQPANSQLGNLKGEITIHTNDPDQPQIKVPVYAYVEP